MKINVFHFLLFSFGYTRTVNLLQLVIIGDLRQQRYSSMLHLCGVAIQNIDAAKCNRDISQDINVKV